jgi:hypothetical protein
MPLIKRTFQMIFLFIGSFCVFMVGCEPKKYVSAGYQSPVGSTGSGGLGMTYKNNENKKTSGMKISTSNKIKKRGGGVGNTSGTIKKNKFGKSGMFHVFERSSKKRKQELSLFPAGVSHKYRLDKYDHHTNARKAAKMIKKEEKAAAKNKKG